MVSRFAKSFQSIQNYSFRGQVSGVWSILLCDDCCCFLFLQNGFAFQHHVGIILFSFFLFYEIDCHVLQKHSNSIDKNPLAVVVFCVFTWTYNDCTCCKTLLYYHLLSVCLSVYSHSHDLPDITPLYTRTCTSMLNMSTTTHLSAYLLHTHTHTHTHTRTPPPSLQVLLLLLFLLLFPIVRVCVRACAAVAQFVLEKSAHTLADTIASTPSSQRSRRHGSHRRERPAKRAARRGAPTPPVGE
jgi:hypothetical protein